MLFYLTLLAAGRQPVTSFGGASGRRAGEQAAVSCDAQLRMAPAGISREYPGTGEIPWQCVGLGVVSPSGHPAGAAQLRVSPTRVRPLETRLNRRSERHLGRLGGAARPRVPDGK